ncbi:hypothetical protein F4778DRAFT_123817 [Xylariomycetidae sp. FL2044]|nr:hypothetical protein F4778DRAFT_123817 [Xylariomycetidae sp. FL2044]
MLVIPWYLMLIIGELGISRGILLLLLIQAFRVISRRPWSALVPVQREVHDRKQKKTWTDADGENYVINLDTLILINSCIDRQIQWRDLPSNEARGGSAGADPPRCPAVGFLPA